MTKLAAIVLFFVMSLLTGAAGQFFYPDAEISPVDLWTIPVFALLIFVWYKLDADQHGYKRSPWLNIGVVGVAFLVLPYYFLRSRGFKRGSIATLAMLGVFLASALLTYAGQSAVQGL